ncbi:hypothetical protein KM043_017485 [Ampulex compressa]|nr:hypothetical protein KM043_017485 [Ampulex compressa]
MAPLILLCILLLGADEALKSVALESSTEATTISSTSDFAKDAKEHSKDPTSIESGEIAIGYISEIVLPQETRASTSEASVDASESLTEGSTTDESSTSDSTSSTVSSSLDEEAQNAFVTRKVDGSTSESTQKPNEDYLSYNYRVNPGLFFGRFVRDAESSEDSSNTESGETEGPREDSTDSPSNVEGYQEESRNEDLKGAESRYFMAFPYWYPRYYYEPRHWPSYRRPYNYLRYPIFAGR